MTVSYTSTAYQYVIPVSYTSTDLYGGLIAGDSAGNTTTRRLHFFSRLAAHVSVFT